MSQLLIDLVIGGVAALSILGVGFVCGLCAGRRSVPVDGATPDSRRRPWKAEGPELQRLLSGWHDVRPRLAELATKVRELKQPPKEALAAWRTDLVRVTSDLRRALKDQLRGTDVIARPRVVARSAAHKSPATDPATDKSTLTNEQIVNLLDQRDHESKHNGEAHPPSVRHKFTAKQLIASLPSDGGLPLAFHEVQCDDLSVQEIRYFSESPPEGRRVIVGLGVPSPVKWLMAEIVDCRTALMHGKTVHCVTARFIASLEHSARSSQAGGTAAGRAAPATGEST